MKAMGTPIRGKAILKQISNISVVVFPRRSSENRRNGLGDLLESACIVSSDAGGLLRAITTLLGQDDDCRTPAAHGWRFWRPRDIWRHSIDMPMTSRWFLASCRLRMPVCENYIGAAFNDGFLAAMIFGRLLRNGDDAPIIRRPSLEMKPGNRHNLLGPIRRAGRNVCPRLAALQARPSRLL